MQRQFQSAFDCIFMHHLATQRKVSRNIRITCSDFVKTSEAQILKKHYKKEEKQRIDWMPLFTNDFEMKCARKNK